VSETQSNWKNPERKGVVIMNKLLRVAAFGLAGILAASTSFALDGSGAGGEYGDLTKKICIQSGTSISAWNEPGRADMTNDQMATMTPVGDGTYQDQIDLVPGGKYNFMFFAVSPDTWAPTGLLTKTTYYDCVPTEGGDQAFITSQSSVTVTDDGNGSYISIGGDARRKVEIPQDISKYFVYCNWASTPIAPSSVEAVPLATSTIRLSWSWNSDWGTINEAFKPVDVIAGGKYYVYKATSPTDYYEIVYSTAGYGQQWDDTNLILGNTYYYVVTSSDCYKGTTNANVVDANLAMVGPLATDSPDTYTQMASGRTAEKIPVYFKVEHMDWDYVAEHGHLVWLTPADEDGRVYPYKVQGKITRVYLPRTDET